VEEIAKDIRHSIIDRLVVKKFPKVSFEDVQGLTGSVDMLIGFHNHSVFPVEKEGLEEVLGFVKLKIQDRLDAGRQDSDLLCMRRLQLWSHSTGD